jgi:major membrane immunogen (membrane-anchored lipoprotein)
MIQKVKRLLEYLMGEAGGCDVDILDPSAYPQKKSELTDEDEDEDSKSEELFKQHVRDGKVIKTKNDFQPDDRRELVDLKDNANLIKARIKSRTPSANIKRKQSMLVRKRKIDHDR